MTQRPFSEETPTPASDGVDTCVVQLLQQIGKVINSATLYGPEHRMSVNALDAAWAQLEEVLENQPRVSISLLQGVLYVNGTAAPGTGSLVRMLTRQMSKLEVSGFSLLRGMKREEFDSLVKLLTGRETREGEDFGEELSRRGLTHVQSDEEGDLKRVKRDETVVERQELQQRRAGKEDNTSSGTGAASEFMRTMAQRLEGGVNKRSFDVDNPSPPEPGKGQGGGGGEGDGAGEGSADGPEVADEEVDEVQMATMTAEYVRRRESLERMENEVHEYLRGQAQAPEQRERLKDSLQQAGLGDSGWRELVAKSGTDGGVSKGGDIGALAMLLSQLDHLMSGPAPNPAEANKTLHKVGEEVGKLEGSTRGKIERLGQALDRKPRESKETAKGTGGRVASRPNRAAKPSPNRKDESCSLRLFRNSASQPPRSAVPLSCYWRACLASCPRTSRMFCPRFPVVATSSIACLNSSKKSWAIRLILFRNTMFSIETVFHVRSTGNRT